jgi:FkbM family methyltransferase
MGFLRARHLKQLQLIESDVAQIFVDMASKNGALVENVKSQIGQDIFALLSLGWKKGGYFVEFGATNGVDLSNTYLLEKDFGWSGILAEPARVWHEDLKKNRTAALDFDCVWKASGEMLNFTAPREAEYSTISAYVNSDTHSSARVDGSQYPVKTVSLNDLLARYEAPHQIDYLSVDTEGSELDILEQFDFQKYSVSVVTCEHNYSGQREKIYRLLSQNGFSRMYEGLSRWDDWFVNNANIIKAS